MGMLIYITKQHTKKTITIKQVKTVIVAKEFIEAMIASNCNIQVYYAKFILDSDSSLSFNMWTESVIINKLDITLDEINRVLGASKAIDILQIIT